MQRKLRKQIRSTLLALAMLLSLLPSTALAVETSETNFEEEPNTSASVETDSDTGEARGTTIIEIKDSTDLVEAIENQADGQTWLFTEAGEYNVKPSDADGYTLSDENKINGVTGPFVFPIYVDDLTIMKDEGVGDVTITSSAEIAANIGGIWNWSASCFWVRFCSFR